MSNFEYLKDNIKIELKKQMFSGLKYGRTSGMFLYYCNRNNKKRPAKQKQAFPG